MSRVAQLSVAPSILALAFGCALGCGTKPEPEPVPQSTDSQTNWLTVCRIDAQCGRLRCVCGVCTNPCSAARDCADLNGTTCVAAGEPGAIAQCGGERMAGAGLCLPGCSAASCARGQMCVAGVCTPVPVPTARVAIDPGTRYQVLTGFGATVAFSERDITSHPRKDALYRALFEDLGLDVLRLRNRHGHSGEDDLSTASALIAAARASLGRSPAVFLTSWSPPPPLKANGALTCSGNLESCMLSRTPGGAFDYAGFGAYWRGSLDAYAAVGVVPDYIGIQNNPDWVPTFSEVAEACKFLPVQGTATAFVSGAPVTVEYPGFAEAQAATLAALSGAPAAPRILAPETTDPESVAEYVAALDRSTLGAVSHHLYGVDPEDPDLSSLAAAGEVARLAGKPAFQTEMQADGLGTALLIHHSTTVEGVSAYLQTSLTSWTAGPGSNAQALVGLTFGDFVLQEPYHSLQHFALHTDPGWVRIEATSSVSNLLASSWKSPRGDALTIVLVNASRTDVDAKLDLATGSWPVPSRVLRTVFGGVERSANLGSLSTEGVLRVPARSIATVSFGGA
jgi:glucuronoarabinoxylan endo-1,4-beta-xylanase